MTKAVRIHRPGGPEVLVYEDVELASPGPGDASVRQEAIGLNFIDTYQRSGLYPLPELPWTLGMEGAGIVEAVGEGVSEVAVGDRVGYAGPPIGAYAEARLIPAARLVILPGEISTEQAACVMLQGMTTEYLLNRCYRVQSGDKVLIHAAAGGVGLMACAWAKELGATVIGTVSSPEKAALAAEHGCDHPIIYTKEDFAARVMDITDGEGVPVVYDSVGKDTFDASLECLRLRGIMVSFGQASGAVPPFDPFKLSAKGLFFTRPTLMHYTAKREELVASAGALFAMMEKGVVEAEPRQRYALAEAVQAHRDLEARKTVGSTILLP
jgi:NADPH2:quinone reductase